MSIWGTWAERTYEKSKLNHYPWYWLEVFYIKRTKENSIRLIKFTSYLGIILTTLGIVFVLFFVKDNP